MSSVSKIQSAIDAEVLITELLIVPNEGASEEQIRVEEANLARSLSEQHKAILKNWNGIDLDIIRLFSCGGKELPKLSDSQIKLENNEHGLLIFAADPSGFLYFEKNDGQIYSYDTDGGEIKKLAYDMDDFFGRLVFGEDAESFAGDQWADDLRNKGLLV